MSNDIILFSVKFNVFNNTYCKRLIVNFILADSNKTNTKKCFLSIYNSPTSSKQIQSQNYKSKRYINILNAMLNMFKVIDKDF